MNLKILATAMFLLIIALVLTIGINTSVTSAQSTEDHKSPSIGLINDFDAAVQERFVTEPFFGIRRIQPDYPTNPHLSEYFSPKPGIETNSVEQFQADGWKVGLFLFGRRVTEIKDEESLKFNIHYRLHNPLPVTKNLKSTKLARSTSLLKEIKKAFIELQTKDNYEFESGKWSYFARPVRAQESCLKCHTDYVITEKTGKNTYKFRKRQAGDVNGILLYGFSKDK